MRPDFRPLILGIVALGPAVPAPAQVTTYTWTSNDPDVTRVWSNGANWLGGVPPTSSADTALVFDAAGQVAPLQNIADEFLLNSLTFGSDAPAYTLTGLPLGFRSSTTGGLPTLTQNSAGLQTIDEDLVIGADLTVGGTGPLALGGAISGAGGLTKTGDAGLTLSGANSFRGLLNVAGGTLTVAGGSLAPLDLAVGDGSTATMVQNAGTVAVLTRGLSGGTLALGGMPSGNGSYTLNGGNLTTFFGVVGGTGRGTFVQTGGTYTVTSALTLAAGSAASVGTYTLSGGTLAGIAERTVNINIGNNGSGTFTQTGGTVAAGATFVGRGNGSVGALSVANAGSTWTTTAMTVGEAAGARGTLAVTASGAVTASNTLTLGGTNSTITIDGGTLSVGSLVAGVGGTGQRVYLTDPTGGSALTVGTNNSTSTLSAAIADGPGGSGGLTKVGTGTLTLSGLNTYTGPTWVAGGVLRLGRTGALGFDNPVAVGAAGTLQLAGRTAVLGALTGAGVVENAAAGTGSLTVGDDGSSSAFAGTLRDGSAGRLSLTKAGAGTFTLTGAAGHTGGTTVHAGTLRVGDWITAGSLAGDVANSGTVEFAPSGRTTYVGAITGSGGVRKSGAGTLVVIGANAYTGGTTLGGGTLELGADGVLPDAGTLTFAGGTLSTAGRSDAVGALDLDAGGIIAFGIGDHSLTFDGIAADPNGLLAITGWTGQPNSGRLYFELPTTTAAQANATYADFLGHVQFTGFAAGYAGFLATATTGTYELAPVPEPGAILAVAAVGLGLAGRVRRWTNSRVTRVTA